MSFKIFAAGSDKFNYTQDKCIEGSDFELVKILGIMQQMQFTKIGAAGAVIEYVTPGITDLLEGIATREFVHNMKNAVDILAMNSNSSEGWIYLSITKKNLILSDKIRMAKYSFSPGTNPGKEFATKIFPTLKDSGVNNWGVIRSLSIALSKFATAVSDSSKPAINISITK